MNFRLELYNVRFDEDGVMGAILPYVIRALNTAEDRLLAFMREAIDETSSAPHEWRGELKSDLHRLETIITNELVQYDTGVEYTEGSGAWMRAMVIAYGMGIHGLNGNNIYAGPEGRMVWDDELNAKRPSRVKKEHEIPQSWYHAGGAFVQNAVRNLQVMFADIISSAIANVPASVFSNNIVIRRG